MAWSTFFGTDAFTGTQYTALPTYNSAYAQNTSAGTWRLSTNGTSAGAVVAGSARCYLVSAPGNDQAGEFTVNGSNVDKYWGIGLRFTDDSHLGFWGGIGYIAFNDVGNSRLQLERLNGGGAHTNLAVSGAYTPTTGDVLRFEIIVSALEVFVNGVSKITVSDATYASGTVALWTASAIDDLNDMSIDNYTVYEQVASGQPTMKRWGGVPFVGGRFSNASRHGGGVWGRTREGLIVPRRHAA